MPCPDINAKFANHRLDVSETERDIQRKREERERQKDRKEAVDRLGATLCMHCMDIV